MSRHELRVEANVIIDVNDQSAITRCVENHDEHGVPQPEGGPDRGWRDVLYPLRTEAEVLAHWAYNAVHNGTEDASRLEGWADMAPGTVTMYVEHVEVIE